MSGAAVELATMPVPRCPLCASDARAGGIEGVRDWAFGCVEGEWTFVRCAACASLYLDPRPTDAALPDAYGRYYTHNDEAAAREPAASGLRKRLVNTVVNARFGLRLRPALSIAVPAALAARLVPPGVEARFRYFPKLAPGARVLDVGCGSGRFLSRIADAGWEGYGVDRDPKAVARARQRGLRVLDGDVDAAATFGVTFEAVTLNHVIEHVSDPRATLTRCFELLEPGGFLQMEYPNPEAGGLDRFGRYWRGLEAPRHLTLPSEAAIARLLGECGFSRVRFIRNNLERDAVAAASLEIAQRAGGAAPAPAPADAPADFIKLLAWR